LDTLNFKSSESILMDLAAVKPRDTTKIFLNPGDAVAHKLLSMLLCKKNGKIIPKAFCLCGYLSTSS
jgi:hypothetical protein